MKAGETRARRWRSAAADFNEKGRTAALAIDSQPATGWGVTAEAEVGRPHALIAALERPLAGRPRRGRRRRGPRRAR